MKKYHMAWVQVPSNSNVFLGSTDTILVKWFLDELKKIVPKYELLHELHDLNGDKTFVSVRKLNHKDYEIPSWLLQQLLQMGWEPFSVVVGYIYGTGNSAPAIYMRREIANE